MKEPEVFLDKPLSLNCEIDFYGRNRGSVRFDDSVLEEDAVPFARVLFLTCYTVTQAWQTGLTSRAGQGLAQALKFVARFILSDRADVSFSQIRLETVEYSGPGEKGFSSVLTYGPESGPGLKIRHRGFDNTGRGFSYFAPTSALLLAKYIGREQGVGFLPALHSAVVSMSSQILNQEIERSNTLKKGLEAAVKACRATDDDLFALALLQQSDKGREKVLAIHQYDAPENEPPLHAAVRSLPLANVRILLAQGANTNQTDERKSTSLHVAAACGKREAARFLLEKGAMIDAGDNVGRTPLHLAAAEGHHEIINLLCFRGADPNAGNDYNGGTPLHAAASSGRENSVKALLHNKSDVNSVTTAGETPLLYAAAGGHARIVELLLFNGADVNAADDEGRTALHFAASHQQPGIAGILIGFDAEFTADKKGDTPLHRAAVEGNTATAELILSHHAEPNPVNKKGKTPLDLAIDNGHEETMDVLYRYGAAVGVDSDEDPGRLDSAVDRARSRLADLARKKKHDPPARDETGPAD